MANTSVVLKCLSCGTQRTFTGVTVDNGAVLSLVKAGERLVGFRCDPTPGAPAGTAGGCGMSGHLSAQVGGGHLVVSVA